MGEGVGPEGPEGRLRVGRVLLGEAPGPVYLTVSDVPAQDPELTELGLHRVGLPLSAGLRGPGDPPPLPTGARSALYSAGLTLPRGGAIPAASGAGWGGGGPAPPQADPHPAASGPCSLCSLTIYASLPAGP